VLDNGGSIHNGIKKAGTTVTGPAAAAVTGPATFILAITTAATLTSQDFIDVLSTNPPGSLQSPVAMHFQGGGPTGASSGWFGSAPQCAVQGTFTDLGTACNLALDPVLSANAPVIGTTWTMCLDSDAVFAGALGFWFLSIPPFATYTDAGSGCNVYVDILNPNNFFLVTMFFLDNNGDWCVSVPLPYVEALVGVELQMQMRICAPGGPVGPLAPDWLSNGINVKIGCL
jgi:hypothetical protein